MAETKDGGPHIPAATVCAAIDMLREQFSVGCSEEAEDRDDWAAELDDSGFHEIAAAFRKWVLDQSIEDIEHIAAREGQGGGS